MSAIRPFYHLLPLHLYYMVLLQSKCVCVRARVCVFFPTQLSEKDPGTLLDSESFQLFFANVLNNGILMEREQMKKRKRRKRERGEKKRRREKEWRGRGGGYGEKKIRKRNLCIHLSLPADLHQQQAYHYSLSLPFYFHYSLFVSFFSMMMIYRDFTCSCKKTHPDGCVRTCPPACKESSCDMPTF